MLHSLVCLLGEPEERDDMRPEMAIAQRLALVGAERLPAPVELEHAHDAGESLARDRVLRRDGGFPQLCSCVAPAPDLVANREVGWVIVDAISLVGTSIQDVVDALGV